jgi:hypothetical protein
MHPLTREAIRNCSLVTKGASAVPHNSEAGNTDTSQNSQDKQKPSRGVVQIRQTERAKKGNLKAGAWTAGLFHPDTTVEDITSLISENRVKEVML